LCSRLHQALRSITEHYEIVLVFDCSPDDGWERICEECKKDSRVKGIQLSRNFGQHNAITAGLSHVRGEWVVVMDCDLQDQPEDVPLLFSKAQEGYDLVLAQRLRRKDSALKKMSSACFSAAFGYLTDSEHDSTIANFGIYHCSVVQAILSMGDQVRCLPVMAQWVGYKSEKLPVEHASRGTGESSYSWIKLFRLAKDVILTFSDKPLHLTVNLGMIICIGSVLVGILYLLRYVCGGILVSGFTSLILSIWFLSGVIIFVLGVLGVYLGRVFDQVKDRPTYLIRKKENF